MFLKLFSLLSLILFVSSNNEIRNLKPPLFWNSFVDLSQIPRCSSKEHRIREEFIKRFAERYNFKFQQDSYGNCVVKVPATPGKENKPTIVIQSHLDMVCEKNRGSKLEKK
jgi:dipeptidase D